MRLDDPWTTEFVQAFATKHDWSAALRNGAFRFYPIAGSIQNAVSPVGVTRPCVSHAGSRLHQLIVDKLVWIGSDAEFAAERTVQGEDHENEQPDKDGLQDDLDPLQSRILDLKKKG
jgi:hypothetical protein